MQMSEWGDPEPRTRELCNPRFPAFVDRRDLRYPVQMMATILWEMQRKHQI